MKIPNFILIAILVTIIASCGKAKLENDITSSSDNSVAEYAFNDVYKVVNETSEGNSNNKTRLLYSFGDCATVTINPAWTDTVFPKTIIVDFGASGCTGYDGKIRKGKISYTITGRYRDSATVLNITPIDYYLNDYKIEGTKRIINNGRNGNNNISYTINVFDAKITSPDLHEISWTSTRTREWVYGEETNFWTIDTVSNQILGIDGITDDIYSITGTSSGTNRNGLNFILSITTPLKVQLDCKWITEGVLEIQPEDLERRIVDYGLGECDNEAIVTIGENTFNYELK